MIIDTDTSVARAPFWRSLYVQVLIAMMLGVLLGWLAPGSATALKPLGDAFIKLVKMVIAPVIFLTVVTGIAGLGHLGSSHSFHWLRCGFDWLLQKNCPSFSFFLLQRIPPAKPSRFFARSPPIRV